MRYPVLLACLAAAAASPGDQLDEFDDCRFQCTQIVCHGNPYFHVQEELRHELESNNYNFLPYNADWRFSDVLLPLRLLLWDCASNCDYQCQRTITRERKQHNEEVLQFYGKWPFRRVLGVQELALVVFSIGNFVPHYMGWKKVAAAAGENRHRGLNGCFRNVRLAALVTALAWVFSAVFHTRDFFWTERLDYYFAGLTVLVSFHAIGYRYFRLYLPQRALARWCFSSGCVVAYALHVRRLVLDWLYTYNMQANIAVGALQNVLWALLCFSLYTRYYSQESKLHFLELTHLNYAVPKRTLVASFYTKLPKLYSLYPLLLCTIVIAGMALEVFDFPPLLFDLVDAHALWHLVTIVPAHFGWYDWLLWDINVNVWSDLYDDKKEQ